MRSLFSWLFKLELSIREDEILAQLPALEGLRQ
jgi:hypothetical protein